MFACLNKQVKAKSPLGHEFEHGGERGKHQHQTVRGVYSTAPAMGVGAGVNWSFMSSRLDSLQVFDAIPDEAPRTEAHSVQTHDRCFRLCVLVTDAFLPFHISCVFERG